MIFHFWTLSWNRISPLPTFIRALNLRQIKSLLDVYCSCVSNKVPSLPSDQCDISLIFFIDFWFFSFKSLVITPSENSPKAANKSTHAQIRRVALDDKCDQWMFPVHITPLTAVVSRFQLFLLFFVRFGHFIAQTNTNIFAVRLDAWSFSLPMQIRE